MLLTAYSRLVRLAHYYSVVAALDYYYCLPLCGLESMVAVTFTIGNQLGVEIPMPFPNSSVPGWLATSPKGRKQRIPREISVALSILPCFVMSY